MSILRASFQVSSVELSKTILTNTLFASKAQEILETAKSLEFHIEQWQNWVGFWEKRIKFFSFYADFSDFPDFSQFFRFFRFFWFFSEFIVQTNSSTTWNSCIQIWASKHRFSSKSSALFQFSHEFLFVLSSILFTSLCNGR